MRQTQCPAQRTQVSMAERSCWRSENAGRTLLMGLHWPGWQEAQQRQCTTAQSRFKTRHCSWTGLEVHLHYLDWTPLPGDLRLNTKNVVRRKALDFRPTVRPLKLTALKCAFGLFLRAHRDPLGNMPCVDTRTNPALHCVLLD